MNTKSSDVLVTLAEQCRHQVRVHRRRMSWWIRLIFFAGFAVSLMGVVAVWRESGAATPGLFAFAAFAAFFGWTSSLSVIAPLPVRPRIVPYFATQIGEYGGMTMSAFPRGRGLYREIVALEELAGRLGVRPLSEFGFAYDHYDQPVEWHPAAEGTRTAEALRAGLDARLRAAPEVSRDLEALAEVLRAAADKGIDFSLIVRLHSKDSMQAVCTREARQGSFW
jgi:hypothetical protein